MTRGSEQNSKCKPLEILGNIVGNITLNTIISVVHWFAYMRLK